MPEIEQRQDKSKQRRSKAKIVGTTQTRDVQGGSPYDRREYWSIVLDSTGRPPEEAVGIAVIALVLGACRRRPTRCLLAIYSPACLIVIYPLV